VAEPGHKVRSSGFVEDEHADAYDPSAKYIRREVYAQEEPGEADQ
jgi:hypothetical protein